jgi:tellurite methyltransferase
MMNLQEEFGNIDIYLFDQLLKGRISSSAIILDAGCGDGRNLIYFFRRNYEVFGVDLNARSIDALRLVASKLAPTLPKENILVADLVALPFPNEKFDLVISSAVLHFASDEEHFEKMLNEMWRTLKPGGMFFARLASSIGIEKLIQRVEERRFLLPDGSVRFLVDEEMLEEMALKLKAKKIEPLKTTNVENLRCMTTWVLGKAV